MKDFIIAVIILALLIVIFSTVDPPADLPGIGTMPMYPGDSGAVVQGNGSDMAEMVISESQMDTDSETEEAETAKKRDSTIETESSTVSDESTIEINKEEPKTMNEIALAYIAGVATILIGEVTTLAIMVALRRIFGCKEVKNKDV